VALVARSLLCYLYYDLEGRSSAFRAVFAVQDLLRRGLSRLRNEPVRLIGSHLLTIGAYYPWLLLGMAVRRVGGNASSLPLSFYRGYSYSRIRQDAYDRFFTRVEQRVSLPEIERLARRHYDRLTISRDEPYWHFLAEQNG
jgi:hypothetical protein